MNWFEGILAGMMQGIGKGLGAISLYGVIKDNLVPNATTKPFGTLNFTDMFPSIHSLLAENINASFFWSLGWVFLTLSIVFLAMHIQNAPATAIQRDRVKQGALGLVTAAVLMGIGPYLAMAVAQGSSVLSLSILSIDGVKNGSFISASTGGTNSFLAAFVYLLQEIMAVIVWVIYRFRAIFLDVWIAFFPLAMAMYANDKTRGIAKLWWTEWIYQMLIPFGQSVVVGLSASMVSGAIPGMASLNGIFVAIAGTVGMLASVIYVRRLVDTVAQAFGTSALGHSSGESVGHAIAVGGAVAAGDAIGGFGVRMAGKAVGSTVGRAGLGVLNRTFANKAQEAVNDAPEMMAGAIAAGASMDEAMAHHRASHGQGAPFGASMTGLERVDKGMASSGAGYGGSSRGGSRRNSFGGHPIFSSRTAGAVTGQFAAAKDALAGSNFGIWAQARKTRWQNNGGLGGVIADEWARSRTEASSTALGRGINKISRGTGKYVGGLAGSVATAGWLAAGVAANAIGSPHLAQYAHQRVGDVDRATSGEEKGEAIGNLGQSLPQAVRAGRTAQRVRMNQFREHLRQTAAHNALAGREANIAPGYQERTNEDGSVHTWFKATPAIIQYDRTKRAAIDTVAQRVPGASDESAENTVQGWEEYWRNGAHDPEIGYQPHEVQVAYRDAYAQYRPALLDHQAQKAVLGETGHPGRMSIRQVKHENDNLPQRTRTFADDARAVLLDSRTKFPRNA